MAFIVATSTTLPSCYYSQEVLANALRKYCLATELNFELDDIERFFTNVNVKGRHFALPLDSFYDPLGLGASNSAAIKAATNLCHAAVNKLFESVEIEPQEVSQLTSATTTVFAVPTIDARLMNRIDFPADVKRVPLSGLGCMAGAAGINRVADYLKGHPEEAAILLSVELASPAWQGSLQKYLQDTVSQMQHNPSLYTEIVATIISAALFGDGAAGVLLVGKAHRLAQPGNPQVVASRSVLMPHTEHLMGLDIVDTGYKVVLSAEVPEFAKRGLRQAVTALLEEQQLSLDKISHWLIHPGGPKVLQAVVEEFCLDETALALSYETLAEVGNLSAVSVLYMLNATLNKHQPPLGTYGLMVAMGPGFSQEVVLLKW